MQDFHAAIGMALIIGFALLVIFSLLRYRGGGPYPWLKYVAMAVSALLLLQYVIGFSLLADDHSISAIHPILALAVLLPVGAEHLNRVTPEGKTESARTALLANLAALVLVLIVYSIGESN